MAHVSLLVDQLSAWLLALFPTVVHGNLTLNYFQFPEHSLLFSNTAYFYCDQFLPVPVLILSSNNTMLHKLYLHFKISLKNNSMKYHV